LHAGERVLGTKATGIHDGSRLRAVAAPLDTRPPSP
jgi:hypothetical protein